MSSTTQEGAAKKLSVKACFSKYVQKPLRTVKCKIRKRFLPVNRSSRKEQNDAQRPDEEDRSVATFLWQTQQLTAVPDIAYSIICPGSVTGYSVSAGFRAPRHWSTGPSNDDFREAVTDHLNWYADVPSPFISVFLEKRHAENWARKWSERRVGQTCRIATIRLNQVQVLYSVTTLVNELSIPTRLLPNQYEDELLVLSEIPATAVLHVEDVFGVNTCKSLTYAPPTCRIFTPSTVPIIPMDMGHCYLRVTAEVV